MTTKPTLCLIPSAYKASKVYSVLPNDGTGDFDFSRASNATRINKDGLIETVDSNVPRLNYPMIDGVVSGCPSLLLEPARTNLITHSEDFSNASWTKIGANVTSGFISPNGTTNAFKLVEDSATSTHELEVTGITVVADKYTMSLFAKAGERSKVRVQLRNYFTGDPSVIFDLENGTFEQNSQAIGSMTLLGNGFYRCTFTTVLNAIAGPNAILNVNLVNESNQISYAGDGTSGLYIFGAMLEQGNYATSYIPTSGSSVTRDIEYSLGQLTTGFFNDSEGTLFLHFKSFKNDTSYRYLAISDGTVSNRVVITLDDTFRIQCAVALSGVTQSNVIKQMTNDSLSAGFKVAMTYKNNEFKSFVNGVETTPRDTSGSVFPTGTLKYLRFTQGNATSNPLNGETLAVQYYNTALSDAELAALTQM